MPAAADHELADHVAELAHVARPVVAGQPGHQRRPQPEGGRGASRSRRCASPMRRQLLAQEVDQQAADVVAPLAQRRQPDLVAREPVEERRAERPRRRPRSRGPRRWRRARARRPAGRLGADRLDLAGLQHAQQHHLHLGRRLADLVEEQGAAVRPRGSTRPGPAPSRCRPRAAAPNSSEAASDGGMAPQVDARRTDRAPAAGVVDARAPPAPCRCPSRRAAARATSRSATPRGCPPAHAGHAVALAHQAEPLRRGRRQVIAGRGGAGPPGPASSSTTPRSTSAAEIASSPRDRRAVHHHARPALAGGSTIPPPGVGRRPGAGG